MTPTSDEDLIRDPAIRQAVEARRATEPARTQSRRWRIGWLILAAHAIGMALIVLIGLIQGSG